MKNALKWFAALLFLSTANLSQAQIELDFSNGCNFASDKTGGTYTLFNPDEDAKKIVDEILRTWDSTGLKRPKFTLQVANVENAQASERKGTRYLLYSHKFMEEFKKGAQTKWAAYFVFAHEIGHHANNHDFTEKDIAKRRKMELEADRFAAIILARMQVSRSDAMAAIQNLKIQSRGNNTKPEYYPEVSAREEAISIAYDKEFKAVIEKSGGTIGTNKTFISLDPAAFNRWNLLSRNSASGYINDEKVVVQFKIPPQYHGRQVEVILCSHNPNIRVSTLKGTGLTVASAGEKTVEWNYQMDFVPRAMASQPNTLRIYVYDVTNKPKAIVSPETKKKCWILSGTGATVGLAGIWPFLDAKSKHENYLKYTSPNDPFYTEQGTDRESYYKKADNKYVGAQVMMYTGGALILTSIVWSAIEKNKAKKEMKNTFCAAPPRFKIEPMFIVDGNSPGAGVRIKF
jgi:hypothetical protein